MERETIYAFVLEAVKANSEGHSVDGNTVLLGKDAVLSSLMLVGVLVQIEDFCQDHNIPFDWAMDSAMSEKRSHYRTVASLTEFLLELAQRDKAGVA